MYKKVLILFIWLIDNLHVPCFHSVRSPLETYYGDFPLPSFKYVVLIVTKLKSFVSHRAEESEERFKQLAHNDCSRGKDKLFFSLCFLQSLSFVKPDVKLTWPVCSFREEMCAPRQRKITAVRMKLEKVGREKYGRLYDVPVFFSLNESHHLIYLILSVLLLLIQHSCCSFSSYYYSKLYSKKFFPELRKCIPKVRRLL